MMPLSQRQTIVRNFGRNVAFEPQRHYVPTTEDEVLDILARHRGDQIRAIGSLHAWSEAARCDQVLLDLRKLNEVKVEQRSNGVWVTVGAGCQIKRVLSELDRQANATTPSVGLITEQTIAGATATGTHGSGKHSLSHFLAEVRIATYDAATGTAVIRTVTDGPELLAARCSLGCLGIVLSVGFYSRPQYHVEEFFQRHDRLEDVLAAEDRYPLQQFYFVPWAWTFFAQHRREVDQPRSRLAGLYRVYFHWYFDIAMHLVLTFLARTLRSRNANRGFFRYILPRTVLQCWRVTDKSQTMLVMEHELFRHIEIEVFVKGSRLVAAVDFLREFLCHCSGDKEAFSTDTQARLRELGLQSAVEDCAGVYTHGYPICIRKVLPDETLISMASSADEPHYAISFISYERPSQREGFFRMARGLSAATTALFEARPHWGKVCPLDARQAEALYPHLAQFREVCREFDPQGVFRNAWIGGLLFPEESHNDDASTVVLRTG